MRKANPPGMARAKAPVTAMPVTRADIQALRRRAASRSIAGQTFSSAPKAASAPIVFGCRAPASSAATATAVTITS